NAIRNADHAIQAARRAAAGNRWPRMAVVAVLMKPSRMMANAVSHHFMANSVSLSRKDLCSPRDGARARIGGVIVDTSRRLQSLYVPVDDGVRLAVDVWLPV